MLVTDVGALAETIPDQKAGYVVNPDEKEISAAIIDFYENKRQREFEVFVSEEKKRFSWSNMTKSIIEVINQINKA